MGMILALATTKERRLESLGAGPWPTNEATAAPTKSANIVSEQRFWQENEFCIPGARRLRVARRRVHVSHRHEIVKKRQSDRQFRRGPPALTRVCPGGGWS
jgi:hypothetical protein